MAAIKIILPFATNPKWTRLIQAFKHCLWFYLDIFALCKSITWQFSETLKVYIDYYNSGLSESSGARTKLMLPECDSFNINSCQNVKILHASGKQEIWYYLLVSCAALRCWHSWQVVTTWQYLWLTWICQSFNCVKQEMLDIFTKWKVWVTCCLFYVVYNLEKCDCVTR